MSKFLCLILDSNGKQIAEFQIEAIADWYAKSLARTLFINTQQYTPSLRKYGTNWTVDVVEI